MTDPLDQLTDALLHEGYLLYPYRRSALKNQHRYPIGSLYPEPFCETQQAGDPSSLQMECIAFAPADATVEVRLRFLQHLADGAIRREVEASVLTLAAAEQREALPVMFSFPPIAGALTVVAAAVAERIYKLTIRVANRGVFEQAERRDRDEALLSSLVSPHLIVRLAGGSFASLIDPPEAVAGLVADCRNLGTWPVLAGDRQARDTLLAAPIILSDHPEIAPESPGDFFDGTEIDELLSLRILTLGEDEKREMARADDRTRALLERTESLGPEGLRTLHGARRVLPELRPGLAVRLRPRGRADIFDLALADKRATVESIEQDLEGRLYVAVTVDEDPGKDLGAYGHRFFFRPEEVEPW